MTPSPRTGPRADSTSSTRVHGLRRQSAYHRLVEQQAIRSSNSQAAIALALGSALLAVLLALVVVAHGPGPVLFDAWVIDVVQGLHVARSVWEALSWTGGPLLVCIDVLAVVLLIRRREFALALLLVGVLLAVVVGVAVIKDVVERPRPADPLVYASGYSFPSGHATESMAAYGLLAIVLCRIVLGARARLAIGLGITGLVLLIGCSRVALGVHYPTDVLAGWLIGIAVVAVVAAAVARLWPWPRVVP